MVKFFRSAFDFILFVLGFDCKARRDAVDTGLCDFSGQGRDKFGK